MTTTERTVMNITLVDEDSKLPVTKAIVHSFGNIITEEDNQTTILQLIVDTDIKTILDKHNEVRSKTVNQTVLERTGKKVMLQPVTIKDLSWKIN